MRKSKGCDSIMSNRRTLTKNASLLVLDMIAEGEEPVFDYVLRSAEEQKRLFDKGKSQLDGYEKISNHQKGKAVDIYLTETNIDGFAMVRFDWDRQKAEKWHKIWEECYGGREMIEWDLPHFEV